MGLFRRLSVVAFVFVSCLSLTALQSTAGQASDDSLAAGRSTTNRATAQPRVVRFSGVLLDSDKASQRGVVGLTFTMYSEPQGGSPIWVETQNVNLDGNGRYSALLGAASGDGLPLSLFASGEARWLGVRVAEEGAAEQARIQLVSVPYALAAADAQSLGGRPATDFQLTRAALTGGGTEDDGQAASPVTYGTVSSTVNTVNRVARFTALDTLGNSLIFDNGSNVGIGTVSPTALFHVSASAGDAFNLYTTTTAGGSVAVYANHSGATSIGYAGFFTKTGAGTTNIGLYAEASGANNNYAALFQGGSVGIGTSSPTARLQVNATSQDAINVYTTSTGGGSSAVYASHTGASPQGYAGYFSKTGAGATNIGLLASATGGTNNYAALFPSGRVGIGTSAPTQPLEVAGTVYSTTGGFKFPDGTVQTSAAAACVSNCGTISGVTAGLGLTGGGVAGTVALAANFVGAGGDGGAATTVARGDHLHDTRYLNLTGGTLSGSLLINRSENASALNELRFADNGQIRSLDNNHRLIFDRAGNAIELREFGDIILSPGATVGARTDKARFYANGAALLKGGKGTFSLLEDNAVSGSNTVLLNRLTGNGTVGPQERYSVSGSFSPFIDVGMDGNRNYVIEVDDTPALTVKSGDLSVRIPNMLQLGVESGTGEAADTNLGSDYKGLVVRRVASTIKTDGSVVAKTNRISLKRDGTNGGLRATIPEIAFANSSVACMGVTSAGSVVGKVGVIDTNSGIFTIWTDAQNVVYFSCSFGASYEGLHNTQVMMHRQAGDYYWVGTLTSSVNQ